MKRKIAWLALPFLLGALIFGAKWRADHPTPSTEDLGMRALMLKSSRCQITHNLSSFHYASVLLSKTEFAVLANNLFLSPNQNVDIRPSSSNDVLHFDLIYPQPKFKNAVSGVSIEVNIRTHWGWMNVRRKNAREGYKLHPVTVKRWIKLLATNLQLGPELRARMK